jgi:hypothetical protein
LHCMIAWGSYHAENPLSPSEHAAMEATLAGKEWVRVFPGCVVVQVSDAGEHKALKERLMGASAGIGNRAHVLLSPPMLPNSGFYSGYLASNLWPELNKMVV